MKYRAVFLDDEEFESLPYRDMGEKVGVADPKQGVAYARKSGLPILDAFNIMHELEHLEEGHEGIHADHFDPEYGVYYKGFGNIFSGIGGALSNVGGAVSRGAGAISRGVGGLFGGGGNQAGVGSSPIPSPFSMSTNSPQKTSGFFPNPSTMTSQAMPPPRFTMSSFRGGAGLNQSNVSPNLVFNPNTPATTAASKQNTMLGLNKFFPSGGFPSINLNLGGGGGGGGGSPTPQAQPAQSQTPPAVKQNPLQGLFGQNANLGQIGMGTALAGFGELASPKVKMPNLAELPSVQALRGMNLNSFKELDPQLAAAINRDFDMIDARERDRLMATYKSLRPGADIESDSSFRRDIEELQRAQGFRRVDALAKYRFEFLTQQLQLSELEMRQMVELANLDVATIMGQLGIDSQSAQDFKQTFSDIGKTMISSGMGINQPQETQ